MTIYLFIDLPFNEIGCYPTSLRDEERERESERGEGKSRAAINGATNFLFLSLWLPSAWIQSHSTSARTYERSDGLHSGQSSLSHISSHFSPVPSHSLL